MNRTDTRPSLESKPLPEAAETFLNLWVKETAFKVPSKELNDAYSVLRQAISAAYEQPKPYQFCEFEDCDQAPAPDSTFCPAHIQDYTTELTPAEIERTRAAVNTWRTN
jgi:hypothetical protein